ncbi:Uncharacterized protein APZ42_008609, partial [Daphnia magna]
MAFLDGRTTGAVQIFDDDFPEIEARPVHSTHHESTGEIEMVEVELDLEDPYGVLLGVDVPFSDEDILEVVRDVEDASK